MKNRGGVAEVYYDTDYLVRGTHGLPEIHKILIDFPGLNVSMPKEGFTDPTFEGYCRLYSPGHDFRSCGVTPGQAITNDTDGSAGVIVTVAEDELTCTLEGGSRANWAAGDQFSIYASSLYGMKISTIWTDRRFGRKVMGNDILIDGLIPDDVDLDELNENIFGPGQPKRR
jgi:hypothetical protein